MKQLTCEMCGSTNLMKQDGVFVCQSCGTKYSTEEAKKLMIEGTVDVTGSAVKIDSSEDINNLFILARRAKAAGDFASATKYYQMITVKDPKNWEAYFLPMCFKLDECSVQDLSLFTISVARFRVLFICLIHFIWSLAFSASVIPSSSAIRFTSRRKSSSACRSISARKAFIFPLVSRLA